MSVEPFIIRFAECATLAKSGDGTSDSLITRVVGTVQMKHLLPLIHKEALAPNPRSARVNRVTRDVLASLDKTPESFLHKSKGILLGLSSAEELQRNRYRISFSDPSVEGVLDGGHNLLAIALHMLRAVAGDSAVRGVKSWDDLVSTWPEFAEQVESSKEQFNTLIPLELLMPSSGEDEVVDAFQSALIEICSARNNNVQLPNEAAANKKGLFEELKSQVPESIQARTEWKPNTWEDEDETRPIRPRDLVALAWIPLNLLAESGGIPEGMTVSAQNIYRNKGECQRRFEELMVLDNISEEIAGGRRMLIHEGVRSALKIAGDLPELYDLIYEEFPDAYNQANRRFRANPIVKLFDPEGRKDAISAGKDVHGYTATAPTTPFMRRLVKARNGSKPCSYPEGLIVPLVYGLKGLMEVNRGRVRWKVDGSPEEFVKSVLPSIANSFHLVLEMAKWDPQKISKNPASHDFAVLQFAQAAASARASAHR